ncbi:glycoside hydrolase [Pseudovirgaria hyperparasitica]|uniref:Glycoside hydrolase n=1 Tax=Pseudovirgaria hyperparasitica TaxID=470096 RepID=A0A6A6W1D7_9PEZI|nr:glycoside hydrolase [Pseudovirgaria hyperparasitica]KAF2756722.1 glycoside hydrolase [Pseudovirgaria hyperparasitica]
MISSGLYLPALAVATLASAWSTLFSRQYAATVIVDLDTKYQTIDGFGFSAAFQRANLIVALPEPRRSELVNLLFNSTSGAGFSILRNGIGSSPDSSNDYMNSILPISPGGPGVEPQYVWDGKDSGQLWLSREAARYGVDRFYANAWSAPGFMKTNGDDRNGGYLCGVTGTSCSSGDWRQAYANYLVKYIQLYADAGVNITDVGFLNEPDLSTSYASMLSSGAQAAEFIKILAPTLQSNGLSNVGITCCEATGWNITERYLSELKTEGAEELVNTISSHEYSSRVTGPLDTTRKIWQTEYSDLSGSWSTGWYSNGGAGDGYTWANTVYDALTKASLSAYLYWECIQDTATNNNNNEKLVLIDGESFEVSKRLWAFAQFSRTVRPGAVRIGASGGELKVTAFQNIDGQVAVNIINPGVLSAAINIAFDGFVPTTGNAWLTDNSRDMVDIRILVLNGMAYGAVPPKAMVSFLLAA